MKSGEFVCLVKFSSRYTLPPASAKFLLRMVELFMRRIQPLCDKFCDEFDIIVHKEPQRVGITVEVLAQYGYMWSGRRTKLIHMLLRNFEDVIDFQRVFHMLVQQWFQKSFDDEKDYLKSINLGVLPSLPTYCGPPGRYPLWIEKLYHPWYYLDYPDGGFLHNNPLLYPIQGCYGRRPKKSKKSVSFADM